MHTIQQEYRNVAKHFHTSFVRAGVNDLITTVLFIRQHGLRDYTISAMQDSAYTTTTTDVEWPLFRDNPGRPIPEETLCILP